MCVTHGDQYQNLLLFIKYVLTLFVWQVISHDYSDIKSLINPMNPGERYNIEDLFISVKENIADKCA